MIPAGENEDFYDIKGNLDIEPSLFDSTPISNPDFILVETIKEDEFENQDVGMVSMVSNDDTQISFIPVNNENDYDDPDDPNDTKTVLFASLPIEQDNKDSYVPAKESVPIAHQQRRTQTNNHYSSRTPKPVGPIHVPPLQPVNDAELIPPSVVPLTNGRDEILTKQVNTAEVDVFTQDLYFDTLQEINNEYDVYDDGFNIMTFGQQTFSTNDPTVSYNDPSQGSIQQHGHHHLYTYV